MVEVAVGGDEVDGLQIVLADVLLDGEFFGLVVGSTVDDDTLVGLVAHNVAVFLQHVAGECFYVKHIILFFIQ